MKKKTFIGIALILTIFSLTWIILTPIVFSSGHTEAETVAAHPGFLAPELTLQSLQGDTLSLSDYEGQPVLIFLWASWCSVCRVAMPGLQTVYEAYAPRGFEILAVNTTHQDSLSDASNYFQSQQYTYPMLLDRDGTISQKYQLYALPTSVLVGPEGIVREVIIGSGMSEGFLRARLENIFNESD